MNRISLINPPSHYHDVDHLAPPLGLLVLARVAEAVGWEPQIIDLNLPCYRELANSPSRFLSEVTSKVLDFRPRVVALTSMGLEAHVSLLLARSIKNVAPDIKTVVGGPFFGSIAEVVRRLEPAVDIIVKGEGERLFANLLQEKAGARANCSPRDNLLSHPFSSYRLIDLNEYFKSNSHRLLNYEAGRGCIFQCGFCYSPTHYHEVRSISPVQFRNDFEFFSSMGAKHVFVVNDNFVNDPSHAIALCKSLAEARLDLTWNCYATLPQITPLIADGLALSGCRSIYLGIDAVSKTQQKSLRKKFFKTEQALLAKVRELTLRGILPTCAFIFDLFDLKAAVIGQTFRTAALCAQAGGKIRFNALARYPGTALARGSRTPQYSEARAHIMLDCSKIVRTNPFAQTYPECFPFHAHECEDDEIWNRRLTMIWSAQRLIQRHSSYFLNLELRDHSMWCELFDALSRQQEALENKIHM